MKLDKPVNFRKASVTVLGEDAIDHIYFFKGDEYWKYDNYHGEVLGDYPAQIWDERSGGWKGLPDDLDAAVKYTETSFFFFKDKNYWRYDWDGSNDINGIGSSGTIKDGWKGIEGPLDAAVKGLGDDFFLFQGDKYWWYEYSKTTNNRRSPVDGDKIAGNWDTIPAGFKPTAAVRFRDYVYLFNETKYYKFDLQANKVVKDYPRDMILWGDDFLGLDAALQGQETSIRYEAYDKLLVFEEGCKFDIVSNPNSYVVEVNCNYISNAN
jgi:hypothetical protein